MLNNVLFDTYSLYETFDIRITCNYPEANTLAGITAENITLITSKDRPFNFGPRVFASNIPGNWTVKNIDVSDLYSTLYSISAAWLVVVENICLPMDDLIQIVSLDGLKMSVNNDNGSKINLAASTISFPHYRKIIQRYNNIDVYGYNNVKFPPLIFYGSQMDEIYISNFRF